MKKVFEGEYYTFAVLSMLKTWLIGGYPWCNTPESITPLLHQIHRIGVILSRVLHHA